MAFCASLLQPQFQARVLCFIWNGERVLSIRRFDVCCMYVLYCIIAAFARNGRTNEVVFGYAVCLLQVELSKLPGPGIRSLVYIVR